MDMKVGQRLRIDVEWEATKDGTIVRLEGGGFELEMVYSGLSLRLTEVTHMVGDGTLWWNDVIDSWVLDDQDAYDKNLL